MTSKLFFIFFHLNFSSLFSFPHIFFQIFQQLNVVFLLKISTVYLHSPYKVSFSFNFKFHNLRSLLMLLLRYEGQRDMLYNQTFNLDQVSFAAEGIKDAQQTVSVLIVVMMIHTHKYLCMYICIYRWFPPFFQVVLTTFCLPIKKCISR